MTVGFEELRTVTVIFKSMPPMTDDTIVPLLRIRCAVQRKLRSAAEDLEAIENELEEAIARVENRRPVRKAIDIRTIDLHASVRGE